MSKRKQKEKKDPVVSKKRRVETIPSPPLLGLLDWVPMDIVANDIALELLRSSDRDAAGKRLGKRDLTWWYGLATVNKALYAALPLTAWTFYRETPLDPSGTFDSRFAKTLILLAAFRQVPVVDDFIRVTRNLRCVPTAAQLIQQLPRLDPPDVTMRLGMIKDLLAESKLQYEDAAVAQDDTITTDAVVNLWLEGQCDLACRIHTTIPYRLDFSTLCERLAAFASGMTRWSLAVDILHDLLPRRAAFRRLILWNKLWIAMYTPSLAGEWMDRLRANYVVIPDRNFYDWSRLATETDFGMDEALTELVRNKADIPLNRWSELRYSFMGHGTFVRDVPHAIRWHPYYTLVLEQESDLRHYFLTRVCHFSPERLDVFLQALRAHGIQVTESVLSEPRYMSKGAIQCYEKHGIIDMNSPAAARYRLARLLEDQHISADKQAAIAEALWRKYDLVEKEEKKEITPTAGYPL
jgi:hypothetical protein